MNVLDTSYCFLIINVVQIFFCPQDDREIKEKDLIEIENGQEIVIQNKINLFILHVHFCVQIN